MKRLLRITATICVLYTIQSHLPQQSKPGFQSDSR